MCKGPTAGANLALLRNREKAGVAGVQNRQPRVLLGTSFRR